MRAQSKPTNPREKKKHTHTHTLRSYLAILLWQPTLGVSDHGAIPRAPRQQQCLAHGEPQKPCCHQAVSDASSDQIQRPKIYTLILYLAAFLG